MTSEPLPFKKRTRDSGSHTLPTSEHLFSLLVSSVRDYAIFMLDSNGYVMTWNEGAQRIKGYRADEIIGKHFSTFYTAEAREILHPQHELEIAKAQGRYEEEGWRLRKDGTMFWANVVITALFQDGELVGFAKVTRDLTERRKAEEAREEHARRLQETNEELQRLAYVVSHELQAPISTIARYSNLFTVRYRDVLGVDAYEFLDRMNHATKLVGRMVDDLWTYARVSKPNPLRESVYIRNSVVDALEELGDAASHARIIYDGLPTIEANKAQMTLLFKELLKNGIRYKGSEPVRIEIQAEPRDDGWLFSVKDNGIGLDKVYTVEAFQLFHRLRGGPEPDATGMGLSICKKIVQQHGGSIWFESEPMQGTTFFVWLPERSVDF